MFFGDYWRKIINDLRASSNIINQFIVLLCHYLLDIMNHSIVIYNVNKIHVWLELISGNLLVSIHERNSFNTHIKYDIFINGYTDREK